MTDNPMRPKDPKTMVGVNGDVDPTENVKALVALQVERLDDLTNAEFRRIDDLRAAESRRIDEQAALRAAYDEKLRDAESKRIDAIRAVDVNAVAVANERAGVQATVLAAQVSASAEALRSLVATTSATVAQQFNQVTAQIQERLSTLEKASYEGQGKATYTDPALVQLTASVQALITAQNQSQGRGAGAGATIAYIFGGIGAVGGIVGLVVLLSR